MSRSGQSTAVAQSKAKSQNLSGIELQTRRHAMSQSITLPACLSKASLIHCSRRYRPAQATISCNNVAPPPPPPPPPGSAAGGRQADGGRPLLQQVPLWPCRVPTVLWRSERAGTSRPGGGTPRSGCRRAAARPRPPPSDACPRRVLTAERVVIGRGDCLGVHDQRLSSVHVQRVKSGVKTDFGRGGLSQYPGPMLTP